jgi:hypothetical protein
MSLEMYAHPNRNLDQLLQPLSEKMLPGRP